jgi:hypothetical protein
MIRAGMSERVTLKISVHKTRSGIDHYNIVNESDLKSILKKVMQLHSEVVKRLNPKESQDGYKYGYSGRVKKGQTNSKSRNSLIIWCR